MELYTEYESEIKAGVALLESASDIVGDWADGITEVGGCIPRKYSEAQKALLDAIDKANAAIEYFGEEIKSEIEHIDEMDGLADARSD